MKNILTYVDNSDWQSEIKLLVLTLIFGTVISIPGICLWLVISRWILSSWDWAVCFIGYPYVVSGFFSIYHLHKNKAA